MKRQFARIGVAVLILTSCQYLGIVPQQTTDQLILKAEQTAQVARDTFTLFVHLERDNEALLKTIDPNIHVYANTIRAHGLDWVDSLRSATKTFEANRNAQNQANLNTWIATIYQALNQTNIYVAKVNAAIKRP